MFGWTRFLRPKSKPAVTPRARLAVQPLEAREVPSVASFVYTETENTNPGQNAVIANEQNGAGQLTSIGSFSTNGTGFTNDGQLGPQDSDKEVIASPDGRFVFAVNQGSNSVAAFLVQPDGSLALVNGAATPSGGTQPVSLAIDAGRLYVLNRGNELQGQTATIAPTITVFSIGSGGTLTQIAADTTTLGLGLSPSQLLFPPTSNLLFVDTFTPSPLNTATPGANEILPFQVGSNGQLTPAPGGGVGVPGSSPSPFVLGLTLNPTQNIIYAGLTNVSQIGVFSFDSSGNLTLVDTVSDVLGGAGPCWATVSPNGQFLYTGDTGTNSVGVYSLANPLHPTQVQEFSLSGSRSQTTIFELSVDPTGNYVYAIDHEQNAAGGEFPDGNALHILTVAANGTLSEGANSPAFLPSNIPIGSDPQGVAVIAAPGPGVTVVGNSLYLVGGNTNDQLNITPIGASQTGSTGIQVNGRLDGVNINNQTYPEDFTSIYVIGFGGNDNIKFAGSLTVAAVISEGNGNDNIQLGAGSNTVTLGDGNDNIHIGNGDFNSLTLGNGNDNVLIGNGNYASLDLGNGNDNVLISNGNYASLDLGNGNDNVLIGNGNYASLVLGNGNDNVLIGNGNYDSITLGNGNDNFFSGNGTSDVLTLGGGHDNVHSGNGWKVA